MLDENELVQCCLSLIASQSPELLIENHDQFLNLTPAAVVAICKLDVLAISEFDLFVLVSDWAVAEGLREQMDVTNINSLRFVLLNVLPNIRFPCMEHEKLAMEVRNSGLLAPEELTDLFAHCLSNGKLETKYPTKPRQLPSPLARSPGATPITGATTTTPKYTSTPSPYTSSSLPSKDSVPRYQLTAQKNSRQASMTKATSRSLTDSNKLVDTSSHKSSHDSNELLPRIDGEPGGDLNTSRIQEGDAFNKDASRINARSRSVVPTNRPRASH